MLVFKICKVGWIADDAANKSSNEIANTHLFNPL